MPPINPPTNHAPAATIIFKNKPSITVPSFLTYLTYMENTAIIIGNIIIPIAELALGFPNKNEYENSINPEINDNITIISHIFSFLFIESP